MRDRFYGITRSNVAFKKIREEYHELERKYHDISWSVVEDVLAFLTDAGLVGRMVMDNQGCWPYENAQKY